MVFDRFGPKLGIGLFIYCKFPDYVNRFYHYYYYYNYFHFNYLDVVIKDVNIVHCGVR